MITTKFDFETLGVGLSDIMGRLADGCSDNVMSEEITAAWLITIASGGEVCCQEMQDIQNAAALTASSTTQLKAVLCWEEK